MNRSNTTDSMEDKFQEGNVFVSGIDGRPTHSDSYMTVLDYVNLEKVWASIKNDYTPEQWGKACAYWRRQNCLSPVLGLLAMAIERKLVK